MHPVLFFVPITDRFWPPDGLPVFGYGAMLFLTFVLTALVWGPRRSVPVGMPKDKLQDLAIVLFIAGIAGARLLYMVQYAKKYPNESFQELAIEFVQIWNGGIVLYGSVFGGLIAYGLFWYFVLRRLRVNGFKLADAVAPLIAFGLALGRIGCYLNGCCWGQPVCEECQPVPLSPQLGQFPILSMGEARDQVILPASETSRLPEIHGLQTSTGFSIRPRDPLGIPGDPRAVVLAVEPGSAAEKAGLKPGDRVVEVNGRANDIILELSGSKESLDAALGKIRDTGTSKEIDQQPRKGAKESDFWIARVAFSDAVAANREHARVRAETKLSSSLDDLFWLTVREWPRDRGELQLVVEREGQKVAANFTPRTVPFFPTQLYETVSMLFLMFVLLAFQPFRRHDGQMMVVLMLGYAAHRFLNEAIRIEPTYAMNLTLSQWISVGIFAAGLLLELYLRWSQPKLPSGLIP